MSSYKSILSSNSGSYIFILILISSFIFFAFKDKEKISKEGQTATHSHYLDINNIKLPFDNRGILADVKIGDKPYGAFFDGGEIIFSGGFLLSGKLFPGTIEEFIWANGVLSSSRIRDYQPGKVGIDKNDPKAKIYVLKSSDPPFGLSWQEWKTAVELGAEFYDGDNDGVYNPVDKNNNGIWDTNEDRPNLIGDFTAWCVYNDGVPANERRLYNVKPLGIEIHQTIWAYGSINSLRNSIFIRYKIIYRGNNPSRLDSVSFSFANDFDIGEYNNDLFGTDTLLSTVYGYMNGPDNDFGNNPPTVMAQLLQGPAVFIPGVTYNDLNNNRIFDQGDTPIKTAKIFVDNRIVKNIPGAQNLTMITSNEINIYPRVIEISPRWFYDLSRGLNPRTGLYNNPCTLGVVVGGINCNSVNPKFIFSGDPVTNRGWLSDSPQDIVALQNIHNLTLEKDKPVEIILAYVAGRGNSPLNSITEARKYAHINKLIYDLNFSTVRQLPQVQNQLKTRTFDNRVDIIWQTVDDLIHKDLLTTPAGDTLFNIEFEQYELWVHNNPFTINEKDTTKSRLLASYDVENDIDNLYLLEQDKISISKIFSKGIQLNKNVYSNPLNGYLFYSLDKNPFTGKSLKKGEKLYFTLKKRFLNRTSGDLSRIGENPNNYLVTSHYNFSIRGTTSEVLEVTIGENFNEPYFVNTVPVSGSLNATIAKVEIDEVDNPKLTDDEYQISFFKDLSTTGYSLFWRLKNLTKNQIVLDSMKHYSNLYSYPVVVDGFSPKIEWIDAEVKNLETKLRNNWLKSFVLGRSGVFYLGPEVIKAPNVTNIQPLSLLGQRKSTLTKFENLRRIEIRFGKKQMAYRFINSGVDYISAASTAGVTGVGKPGEYFVEVPFQVWIKDERFKEERQLACGFLEYRTAGGNPDGQWNPGQDISLTREYIVIFNQSYDPNGRQMEYVGHLPTTGTKTYANLRGWTPPSEANFTNDQINRARSPWFDGLFVIGLERSSDTLFYSDGDVISIPISYAITVNDTFYYKSQSAKNKLTLDQRKSLINSINVFPNPYFGWEDYLNKGVTFSNLPEEVTIKIYTISGNFVRKLTENDKQSITSPFLTWDLKNEKGNYVANGVYLAHITTKFGERVLKLSIVRMRK